MTSAADNRFGFHSDVLNSSEPTEASSAAPVPNFCTRCGVPWDPAWTRCPHCLPQNSPSPDAQSSNRNVGSLRSALFLYFVILTVFSVAFLIALWGEQVSGVTLDIVASSVSGGVTLLWVFLTFRSVFPLLARLGGGKWLLLSAVFGVGTFLLAGACFYYWFPSLGIEQIYYSRVFLSEGYGWGMIFLMVCVIPPLVEELAFRGVILGGLRRVLSAREAILVSAIMFSILHMSVWMIPFTLLLGILTGWVRIRSGSLYPCFLMHLVHNSLVVGTEFIGWS
ncbi:MAG: CPBP family intramembrane metalloprotease [Phycisphaerae bacterium]|nr:CPBP family intramembrane metalloprotease [Phycisphaerae bacterium]